MSSHTLQCIVSMRACGNNHSWQEIAQVAGVEKASQARTKFVNWQRKKGKDPMVVPDYCPVCRQEGGIRFRQDGNYAKVSFNAPGSIELEEALRERGVDLEVWQISSWEFKAWDMGAKVKTGHLEWDQSKMDGYLDYKGLVKEQMCSIQVRLVRRKPILLHPVVQPVECHVSYPAPPAPRGDGVHKVFIIADVQMGYRRQVHDAKLIPFHDRRILDLALQICTEEQPGTILFLGDTADLADWSDKFLKEPSFHFTTQPMILEAHWWFRRFREACPKSRIVVFQGNHSFRIPGALMANLVTGYGLRAADELDLPPQLSLERMWALHTLGIEWVGGYPDEELWLTDWLRAKHGNKAISTPGATAKSFLREGVSTIFGHAHRKEAASEIVATRDGPLPIHAYSPGCACHVDGRVPGHKKSDCWQQGLGMASYKGRSLTIDDIGIVDGQAIWRGAVYTGRDVVPNLREDIPDWNW